MAIVQVAIIGAGIAGASAALALTEIGASVEVFESRLRTVDNGGWVTLGPTAMTAFDEIGIGHRVRQIGFPVTSIHSVDINTGTTHDFPRYEPTHRWPSTHVWRRNLLAVLRHRMDEVDVKCSYGTARTTDDLAADLVVGADGAQSTSRHAVGNPNQPAYTGQIIVFGHHGEAVLELPHNVLHFWTHGQGVVGYVGDQRDGAFWFSRYCTEVPSATIDQSTLLEPLRNTHVAGILDTSEVSSTTALYELAPEGPWHNTDTVIIGDAAHAVSPAAGRGATSAIEDAFVLARSLRNTDSIEHALADYTATRRPAARATYRPTAECPVPRITSDQLTLH